MPGLLDIIGGVASGVVKPVADYFTRKQELAAQAHANDLAALKAQGDRQAQLITQGLSADAAWEMASITAGQSSRNFELYIVSVPLVLCFTKFAPYVKAGFDAISQTPSWFQLVFVTIFLANYGVRFWRRNIASDT